MIKPQKMIEVIMESRNAYKPNYNCLELKGLIGYIIKKAYKPSKPSVDSYEERNQKLLSRIKSLEKRNKELEKDCSSF